VSGIDQPIRLREEPDYFGGCPFCGANYGYLNVGAAHWFSCAEHKTKWCTGENLSSGWRGEEEEADWRHNAQTLAEYAEIEPLHPSWCRPVSREELFQDLRDAGWIDDGHGGLRNPNVPEDF